MMKMQKNQPIGFPCGSIALLVGVVNAAIYLIYSTSVHHFSPLVFAALVAAAISCLPACGNRTSLKRLIMFTRLKLATLISAALFATAFGLYVNDRLIMFEEMINKIYGMTEQGAILWVVLMVFGLMLVGFAAVTYAAFRDDLSTAIKS